MKLKDAINNDNLRVCDKCFVSLSAKNHFVLKKAMIEIKGFANFNEEVEVKDKWEVCPECAKKLWETY